MEKGEEWHDPAFHSCLRFMACTFPLVIRASQSAGDCCRPFKYMTSGELAAGPNPLEGHFRHHCMLSTQCVAWYTAGN